MARRPRVNRLERSEVALIKSMISRGGYQDQDILAFFTRPTRTINHARIGDIRHGRRYQTIVAATNEELENFLTSWPNFDTNTGLDPTGDELLVKAREAMIAAVHTFNSAGLTFRAELFIVTAVIAWTYLLHAWFKREGVDYRHLIRGDVQRTREGVDKYLELGACLRHAQSPVLPGAKRNLEILLQLRHEIEHRSTNRIDEALSAKLQACCINFNKAIKDWFGAQCGLERRIPIALQFVTFDAAQRATLKKAPDLPDHIETLINTYEEALTEEEYKDPTYRYRVAFVPIVKQRTSAADRTIEFISPAPEQAEKLNVLLQEADRSRFTATQVVERMHQAGFPRFRVHDHTIQWKRLDAKTPGKQFGREGDYKGTWVWFELWIARVQAHCEENSRQYQ